MDYGDFVGIGLGSCNRTVHVKVSRLWEYRGGFHHGPVKLVHMILSDSKATMVCPFHVSDDIFPKWIYILTATDELPTPNDTPTCLVDVVGVVTGVYPFLSYNIPRVIGSIRKRRVSLSDCSGHDITLTLWGEAADRFDGDDVYSQGQTTMVVAVFVGTTVHAYGDSKQLAGGSSCKCAVPVLRIPLIRLLNFIFFEKGDSQFRCIARIFRFMPGTRWWTTCCAQCNNLTVSATNSITQPNLYRCSRYGCPCTAATLRYRLSLIGRDSTREAEFIVRGSASQAMIGVPVHEVIKRYQDTTSPIINMHIAASQIRQTPNEFSHIASMVRRFIVDISANGFGGRWPSFLVSSVEGFDHAPMTTVVL